MSGKILNAVWDYPGKDLNSTQTAILSRMAWYASDAGRDIFPTVATLCRQTKFKETAVREAITYLKDNKFLIQETQSIGRYSNKYKINLERLAVTNEFTEQSNTTLESVPPAKRGVESEPSVKRGVNPPPNGLNPSPGDTIKTIKDESKDNNVVVGQKVLELATKVAITEPDLRYFLGHYEIEAIILQMEAMLMQKNIRSPKAWLTKALKDNYAVSTFTTPPLKPASHTIWSQKEHEARCKEAEKLSDPEHWAEKMLQENLTKLKAGSNQG